MWQKDDLSASRKTVFPVRYGETPRSSVNIHVKPTAGTDFPPITVTATDRVFGLSDRQKANLPPSFSVTYRTGRPRIDMVWHREGVSCYPNRYAPVPAITEVQHREHVTSHG